MTRISSFFFAVVFAVALLVSSVAFARPASPADAQVGVALHSAGWTAGRALSGWRALAVRLALAGRPGVLVLDVDETVLDNSPCEGDVCAAYGVAFSRSAAPSVRAVARAAGDAAWASWCARGSAASVPGAVPVVRAAAAAGWRVVWVTGRVSSLAAPTAANLWGVGLPCDPFGGLFCVGSSKNKPAVFSALLASARAAGLPVVFGGDQATDAPLLPVRAVVRDGVVVSPAVPASVWAGFGGWSAFTALPNLMY